MDSIKSQCYVTVATAEEADKLYEALNDLIWPEETGKKLKVSFVPSSALPKQDNIVVKSRLDNLFKKTRAQPHIYYLPRREL